MTTDIKELLPCPFCNSDMSSVVRSADGFCRGQGGTLYVPCDCGAMGPEGKTIDDAIAAWNRRTPVEQLSAQTAEPVAWMNPNESFAPDAFIWNADDIHPEYNVPVFTHPAKTEQPSLSDHQLNYVQECIERAKLLPVWDNVPHSLHAELDNIFRGVALLSAQRRDSDKDAKRYRWLRDRLSAADFYYGDPPRPVLVFDWPANVGVGGNCDRNIDAAIANGAPK